MNISFGKHRFPDLSPIQVFFSLFFIILAALQWTVQCRPADCTVGQMVLLIKFCLQVFLLIQHQIKTHSGIIFINLLLFKHFFASTFVLVGTH